MKVKYNRTSTIQQEGKRFDLDKNEYDLTLFDKGVSGKIPFSERTEGNKFKIKIYKSLEFSKDDTIEFITSRLNSILEKMILKNPDQWIWTHNRWK